MERWEYRVLAPGGVLKGVKPEDMEAQLNELGQQGWEAVGITAAENSGKFWIMLKRRQGGETTHKSTGAWGNW